MDKATTVESLQRSAEELLRDPSTVQDIYGAGLSKDDIKTDLEGFIPTIKSFSERYRKDHQKDTKKSSAMVTNGGDSWDGEIESICDIEDNWWSPRLGFKGKVDATVQVYVETKLFTSCFLN